MVDAHCRAQDEDGYIISQSTTVDWVRVTVVMLVVVSSIVVTLNHSV